MAEGNSAQRQWQIYAEMGNLKAVVDEMIRRNVVSVVRSAEHGSKVVKEVKMLDSKIRKREILITLNRLIKKYIA